MHPAWGDLVLKMENGALRMTLGIGPDNTGVLAHWNYDTFRATLADGRGGHTTLTFELDPAGNVSEVMLDGSEQHRFKRR